MSQKFITLRQMQSGTGALTALSVGLPVPGLEPEAPAEVTPSPQLETTTLVEPPVPILSSPATPVLQSQGCPLRAQLSRQISELRESFDRVRPTVRERKMAAAFAGHLAL